MFSQDYRCLCLRVKSFLLPFHISLQSLSSHLFSQKRHIVPVEFTSVGKWPFQSIKQLFFLLYLSKCWQVHTDEPVNISEEEEESLLLIIYIRSSGFLSPQSHPSQVHNIPQSNWITDTVAGGQWIAWVSHSWMAFGCRTRRSPTRESLVLGYFWNMMLQFT